MIEKSKHKTFVIRNSKGEAIGLISFHNTNNESENTILWDKLYVELNEYFDFLMSLNDTNLLNCIAQYLKHQRIKHSIIMFNDYKNLYL